MRDNPIACGFTPLEKATLREQNSLTGFTLLELLIAVAISSAIILSVYSAFYTGILSSNKMDSGFEVYQSARIILSRIELDLRNSFPYYKSTHDDSRFRGARDEMSFYTILDSFSGEETYSQICRVKYAMEDFPRAPVVRRYVFKGLDALKDNAVVQPQDLSVNLKEVSLRYRYPLPPAASEASDPFPLQDTWPEVNSPDQAKDLPLAVEITLVLAQKEKNKPDAEVTFVKTVTLPLCSKNSKKP